MGMGKNGLDSEGQDFHGATRSIKAFRVDHKAPSGSLHPHEGAKRSGMHSHSRLLGIYQYITLL
jgi:hypothetical protein